MQRPVKFQTKFLQKLAAVIAVSLLLSAAPHVAFAADYSAVTTEGGVKVYWDADFSSYAGALPIGTIVTVTKTGGGVAEFTFQSRTGYCALSDLTAVDDIARPAQVNASGVKVYVAPDTASKSASVSKGTRVNVVAEYKSWAMIERNGVGAYMYAGYLTYEDESPAPTAAPTPAPTQEDAAPVLEAVPAVVTDASLPVYKSASASSAKLGTLKKDMEVNVLANNGTWAYIEREDHYGYCRMSGLTRADLVAAPTPTPAPTAAVDPADFIPAVVTANTAVVYRSANTSSESLGTLKKGATLNVVSFNRTWAYVELNGNYGFCRIAGLTRADLIETPAPTPAPTAAVDPKDYIPAVVTAKSVVVYESASASSPRMGTLKEGAELNVVRFDKDWAYVERAGYFGYCAVSALIPKSQLPTEAEKYRKNYPDVQFTATVIEDAIPIYAEPGDTSPAGSLPIAAQVDIYAYNKSWAYLGIGEMRGFAQIKYMSAAKFDTLTSGDSSGDVTKLQRALEELGYFDGVPGGNFNALTAAAVKRFQAQVGLSQTGTADAATQRVLYGGSAPASSMISTALRSGDKGASVERLQTRLFHLGYFAKASSVDGDYGGNTIAAVRLFQAEADLTADGTADAATLKAIYRSGAPALPSSKTPADQSSSGGGDSGGGSNSGVTRMPSGLASTTTSLGSGASSAQKIEYVIYNAQNQLGKPYIYGTAGPNSYDCSGLTTFAFKKANVSLGRSAYAQGYQANSGTKIESISDLKRGDIVCFDTVADSDLSDHVGIYLGQGYFIHASSGTGNGKQVCISSLSSGYYNRVFSWARRPLQ